MDKTMVYSPNVEEHGAINAYGEDVYRHVGRQLRNLRIGRGMTQAETARLIGVSPQQYQKYEDAQTKCSLNNLMTLTAFYGVSLSDIMPAEAGGRNYSEADLLARLVSAFSSLRDTKEKLRLVQLVEAIRNSHSLEFD